MYNRGKNIFALSHFSSLLSFENWSTTAIQPCGEIFLWGRGLLLFFLDYAAHFLERNRAKSREIFKTPDPIQC